MIVTPPASSVRTASDVRSEGPVASSAFGTLVPVGGAAVSIASESFLGGWQARSGELTIPHCIQNLESSGVLHNFRRVVDGDLGPFVGMQFADSDLYKTLEAIGWESARLGRPVYTDFVDMAIDLIELAQDAGYINTAIQGDPSKEPWTDLVWSHELYCAGHLFQAAVALKRGAGDHRLLVIAEQFAERILEDLGDRQEAYDGHAEVETAFVELYRETRDVRYLDFARTQVERRGAGLLPHGKWGRDYFGDHATLKDVGEATGHAVRQLYFAAAVTDLYLESGDSDLLAVAERVWNSAFATKTYITGGQGSRHADESFGDEFELPPDRAYAETCAGIASFQWNWRMLLATGNARYADAMETVLYNTIAASVALDGTHFFYTNPLQMRTGHRGSTENSPSERLSWFECACCPPNLARLVASLGDYLVTASTTGLQLHQLVASSVSTKVGDLPVTIDVSTNAPWTGSAEITVEGAGVFELAIRVPGWTRNSRAIVNGEALTLGSDGYLRVTRDWTGAATVTLEFEMAPTVIVPHARIDAARGAIAIRRGPFVYCIEGVDQPDGVVLEDIRIDPLIQLSEVGSDAPGVVISLAGRGTVVKPHDAPYTEGDVELASQEVDVVAIPYFAWGNRGTSAMRVWIPRA